MPALDFFEGIHAALVDKDRSPSGSPTARRQRRRRRLLPRQSRRPRARAAAAHARLQAGLSVRVVSQSGGKNIAPQIWAPIQARGGRRPRRARRSPRHRAWQVVDEVGARHRRPADDGEAEGGRRPREDIVGGGPPEAQRRGRRRHHRLQARRRRRWTQRGVRRVGGVVELEHASAARDGGGVARRRRRVCCETYAPRDTGAPSRLHAGGGTGVAPATRARRAAAAQSAARAGRRVQRRRLRLVGAEHVRLALVVPRAKPPVVREVARDADGGGRERRRADHHRALPPGSARSRTAWQMLVLLLVPSRGAFRFAPTRSCGCGVVDVISA